MSQVPRYEPHYTVADYRRWPGDWELWSGRAIAMTPSPFGRHQNVLAALLTRLRVEIDRLGCKATALSELDWIVSDDTVVRPDVVVICGGVPERHLDSPPALVAEVLSPSARHHDLIFKRDLYAQQGVGIYLIIDPDAQTVEHLSLGSDHQYAAVDQGEQLELQVCDECEIKFDVRRLF